MPVAVQFCFQKLKSCFDQNFCHKETVKNLFFWAKIIVGMTCIVMGSIDQVERNLDSMGDRSLMDGLLTCFAAQHIFLCISLKLFIMCCFIISIMGKSELLLQLTPDLRYRH